MEKKPLSDLQKKKFLKRMEHHKLVLLQLKKTMSARIELHRELKKFDPNHIKTDKLEKIRQLNELADLGNEILAIEGDINQKEWMLNEMEHRAKDYDLKISTLSKEANEKLPEMVKMAEQLHHDKTIPDQLKNRFWNNFVYPYTKGQFKKGFPNEQTKAGFYEALMRDINLALMAQKDTPDA